MLAEAMRILPWIFVVLILFVGAAEGFRGFVTKVSTKTQVFLEEDASFNDAGDGFKSEGFVKLKGFHRFDPIQNLVGFTMRLFTHDPDIHRLARNFISILAYAFAILCGVSFIGVETKGVLSLLSVVELTLGLAVQNTLGNTFSGLFLLLFCPFKRGWSISVDNFSGKVISITTR